MGLTIHYDVKARCKTRLDAIKKVRAMHALALELPFDEVGGLVFLDGTACHFDQSKGCQGPLDWLKVQAGKSVNLPWNKGITIGVDPVAVVAFTVEVGEECEPMNIGLCLYPSTVTHRYRPEDDARFQVKTDDIWGSRYSYDKASRYAHRKGFSFIWELEEDRTFRTGLTGWRWGSFCKTQYASDPAAGGVANFLKCHVAAITFLERVAALKGLSVTINDEGDYGPHDRCEDWREADAEGRKRVYVPHPGFHDVERLAREVGSWNNQIAASLSAWREALPNGMEIEAPIAQRQDFEVLEFRGSHDPDLQPFLAAMADLARHNRDAASAAL